MPRYIQVQSPIKLVDLGGKPFPDGEKTFYRYLLESPCNSRQANATMPAMVATMKLLGAVASAEPGAVVDVDEEHWAQLKEAVETTPAGGYDPSVGRQLLPFMRAILDAPDKRP